MRSESPILSKQSAAITAEAGKKNGIMYIQEISCYHTPHPQPIIVFTQFEKQAMVHMTHTHRVKERIVENRSRALPRR